MVKIIVYQEKNIDFTGFVCNGHAGYAESGKDIVCSAVSILVINTINSIEKFTNTKVKVVSNEKKGSISLSVQGVCDEYAQLLLKSMVLGLTQILEAYGTAYLNLEIKEV